LFVLLGSSLLNAAYFLPIVYKAFFCTQQEAMFPNEVQEAPTWCVAPLVLSAVVSIVLFFYPQPFLELAGIAVGNMTGG
jgi:multicomponent Na+:H+ antiporter subunit D